MCKGGWKCEWWSQSEQRLEARLWVHPWFFNKYMNKLREIYTNERMRKESRRLTFIRDSCYFNFFVNYRLRTCLGGYAKVWNW